MPTYHTYRIFISYFIYTYIYYFYEKTFIVFSGIVCPF